MSGAGAILVVAGFLTLGGLGVLALVGVAQSPSELVRRAGLAPLAGMAWAGVVGATLGTAGFRLGIAELIVLTVVTCAGGAARLRLGPDARSVRARRVGGRPELAVVVVALATTAVVCAYALAFFRIKPLAEYDGWAMWGMKARAIAVLGAADPQVFASDAYTRLHLEYPLLLPALHSLPLQVADGFSSTTVVLSCLAIGLAGLLAIWAVLQERVRPGVLLAFVAAIAAMPAFFGQLATGYADVPVAVFVAAGVVAGGRWLVDDEGPWLALASLFLAAAALTKNEGLLFALAAFVALLASASGRRRTVALSAFAVALTYAPWRAYVAIHDLGAPDYDLSSSFDIPWVAGRLDRAPHAAQGLLQEAADPKQFGILLVLGVVAALPPLVLGPRPLGLLGAGFALLSFAGLTWIYVLTPNDVSDYLSTNGNRVVMSLVIGLAALSPLLIEESARKLRAHEPVGTPR